MNIGKMVEKRNKGIKAFSKGFNTAGKNVEYEAQDKSFRSDYGYNFTPSDPQAKALDGSYGNFSPKPAVEVVIVAQKPRTEKTSVDQALAWLNERNEALRGIANAVKVQYNQDVIWDEETQYHPKSA